ncbi:hypothetical protein JCM10908_001810 [Rhodotorula pacifica]|uniref:Eaf6p n=1 Tax=Rhodotorula pacifica TaxID=1495444 RepID=UPI0031745E00
MAQTSTDASNSASTTAAASPQPAPPPNPTQQQHSHPLDGLSPTDLRIKLDQARKELRTSLDKKRKLDRDLATLEQSIYAFEGSYLSDALFPPSATANQATSNATSSQFGNIIRGYDSYLKAPSASAQDRKRFRPGDPPSDKERMFSASSATFHRSVELRAAETAASVSVEPESDDDYGSSTTRRKQRGNRH